MNYINDPEEEIKISVEAPEDVDVLLDKKHVTQQKDSQSSSGSEVKAKVMATNSNVKVKEVKAASGSNANKDNQKSKAVRAKDSVKTIEVKKSPLKETEKKKSFLKASPSMNQKEQKSKRSPKLFKPGRRATNKGNSSDC